MQEYLIIGEITKPQGVRGELKLRPATCDVSRFEGLKTVFLREGEGYREVRVHVRSYCDDAVFLSMEGVNSRDDAEKLRGSFVYVDRAHAVELDEDSNFICDLEGLEGIADDGTRLGKLVEVMQPGGGDVYVFQGKKGEILVPALKSVVLKVDLQKGEMLLSAARLQEVAVV